MGAEEVRVGDEAIEIVELVAVDRAREGEKRKE